MNFALGNSYTVVKKAESPENFDRDAKACSFILPDKNEVDPSIHALVSPEGGGVIYPLYKEQSAYIMTEKGRTFDNLSYPSQIN